MSWSGQERASSWWHLTMWLAQDPEHWAPRPDHNCVFQIYFSFPHTLSRCNCDKSNVAVSSLWSACVLLPSTTQWARTEMCMCLLFDGIVGALSQYTKITWDSVSVRIFSRQVHALLMSRQPERLLLTSSVICSPTMKGSMQLGLFFIINNTIITIKKFSVVYTYCTSQTEDNYNLQHLYADPCLQIATLCLGGQDIQGSCAPPD